MSETPAAIRAIFQSQADQTAAHARELMNRSAASRLLAERTADMIVDQHGEMPGLGRAIVSAAYAVEVSVCWLQDKTDADMGGVGVLNVLAAVGQVLAERETAP